MKREYISMVPQDGAVTHIPLVFHLEILAVTILQWCDEDRLAPPQDKSPPPRSDLRPPLCLNFKIMSQLIFQKRPPIQVVKLLPLPQPPVCARTDVYTNPSAQRATQLRSVLARVYAVSIQNQITTTVP
jgi:hypothetical protein